jgi:beta-glucosidase
MAADAVVVVAGLTDADEGEGLIAAGDRDSLSLPAGQVELITAVAEIGTPTIVVLYGGGTIVVSDWVDDVDALLLAFYPGSEGGHALAELLLGDAAPSGRLPFSVPFSEDDLVAFDHVSFEVTYGYLHGYRHLDAQGVAAQYPFGFGLTYTDFDIGPVSLSSPTLSAGETLGATVEVTNAGTRDGICTVQLYVGRPDDSAPRTLAAFGQLELGAGQTDTLELAVAADDLRTYDVDAGAWRLVAGDHIVEIGTSSANLPLSDVVRVVR